MASEYQHGPTQQIHAACATIPRGWVHWVPLHEKGRGKTIKRKLSSASDGPKECKHQTFFLSRLVVSSLLKLYIFQESLDGISEAHLRLAMVPHCVRRSRPGVYRQGRFVGLLVLCLRKQTCLLFASQAQKAIRPP